MKSATYIDGQNHMNQRAIHRWFWRSVVLLSVLCVGVVSYSVQQYVEYYDLRQERVGVHEGTAQLHACLEKKRQFKEQIEQLQIRLAKINGIKYRPKNPATLLGLLADVFADATLQNVTLKKKELDLVLFTQDTKSVPVYAEKLRTHALCKQVDVVALEMADNRVKALLHIVLH